MENDVIDIDRGRYRGFDVDDEADNDTTDKEDEMPLATACTCGSNRSLVKSLQDTIRKQSAMIADLKDELSKLNERDENTNKKKRKRESDISDVMEAEMIADSADKDILIKELADENEKLKQQALVARPATCTKRPEVEHKSTATKQQRVLPLPNAATLIEEMESAIDDRFSRMQEALGKIIDEKIKNSDTKTKDVPAPNNALPTGSYAEATNSKTQVRSFREIVAAAKNEELAEERERNARINNIIIHGVEEQPAGDEVFYKKLITDLSIGEVKAKSIIRLGQILDEKKRPIKITLSSTIDKEKNTSNLSNLKDKGYNGISITEDHTITERKMIKDFVDQAKQANEKERSDSDIFWVVRGSPKNGLYLKKVTKSTKNQSQ